LEESSSVEDWQEWQIRADQIAAALREEVDALERDFFTEAADGNFRGFWPRHRTLKEKVRTAPAIKLEDKLALERRLRDLGGRAYKGQEAAYARSEGRKIELLSTIQQFRQQAEQAESARDLRTIKRDLDAVRPQFESSDSLVPPARQAVWEAWREATQFVWQRLTAIWTENETVLREHLATARRHLESGNTNAARQAVSRFFDALKGREARQNVIVALKNEASEIRNEASQAEERRAAARIAGQQASSPSPLPGWKAELERSREGAARLGEEVEVIERQLQETQSILEQAMLRGTLVDKRRKLDELERTSRTLEQRIEQAEDVPVIGVG
jgi:hypothetical protein